MCLVSFRIPWTKLEKDTYYEAPGIREDIKGFREKRPEGEVAGVWVSIYCSANID